MPDYEISIAPAIAAIVVVILAIGMSLVLDATSHLLTTIH